MIVDKIIILLFLYLTEIVLILTFCAVCWYSWETRRLVASTKEGTRVIACSAFLASYNENMNQLFNAANKAAKPEVLGFEMGELIEMREKARNILYPFLK